VTIPAPLPVPDAILKRRAVKSFRPEPIDPDLLHRIVELTVAAPSSYNLQDWRIVVVRSPEQKAALQKAAYGQRQVAEAPVTFVFAADAAAATKDLTPILEVGLASGAWPPQTVEYFKKAIPGLAAQLGPKTREYAVKDAMIAATHCALAAEGFGLSTSFMNGWDEAQVKAVIGAADDPDVAIAVLLAVGHAAEPRKNPGRLPLSANVFSDRLGVPFAG
jgi:nitroreductase